MREEKIKSLLEAMIQRLNEENLTGNEAMQISATLFTKVAMATQQPDEVLDDYFKAVKAKVKEYGQVLGNQRVSSGSER
jgi:hypothetical protein